MTTTTGNHYARDADGEPVLLSSRGQQVMMAWERSYMEQCVDALGITSTDRVLEIGFGLAYSAERIQRFYPQCHTIIECDTAVLERARAFEQRTEFAQCVEIQEGTWQNVLPTLAQFDCVFFDDYPLPELEDTAGCDLQQHHPNTTTRRTRWHDFLDVVIYHVRPGARITGYLAREVDLARDGCRVEMTEVAVTASSSCTYYPHDSAFVPVITVVDPALAQNSSKHLLRERLERVREQLLHQEIIASSDRDLSDQVEDRRGDEEVAIADVGSTITEQQVGVNSQHRPFSSYTGYDSRAAYLVALRLRRDVKSRVIAGP